MVRAAAILILLAGVCAAGTGDFVATADFGAVRLRVALHLTDGPDGRLRARADSIDQDAFDLAVKVIEARGRRIEFEIPRLGGRFAGTFSEDGNRIEGYWSQRGGDLPLRFERGNIRPQEAGPPYPYRTEDVVVRNGRVRLAGTLTLPAEAGRHPAIVLITGSGPQDRNETTSGHRPFLVWADYLTRRGWATLRLDDRGVGGSSGSLLDSTDEDFAADARAAVAYLKSRREIDGGRVGLLGHSEGAMVAPLAASHGIAFVVLLAGPAIPGEQTLEAQSERVARSMGVPEELARRNREVERKMFAASRGAANPRTARRVIEATLERETRGLPAEEAAAIRGQLGRQVGMASSRWFRFVLNYDPQPALGRLTCPVLALYGGLDVQVPADLNAPAMEEALRRNGDGRVQTVAGVNHMFQRAETGSPLEYARIEETLAPEVLQMVGDWLKNLRR